MNLHDQQGYIRHTFIRIRPRHYRAKLLVSLIILIFVGAGIMFNWFVRTGVFNFSTSEKSIRVELNSLNLEAYGIPGNEIEADVNRFIAGTNNAQQGAHFLLGTISGFIFAQPTAGLTVGLIKEGYDFFTHYIDSDLSRGYLIDAVVDTTFWTLGGLVGFYLLTGLYDLFREHNINGVKDLALYARGIPRRVQEMRKSKKPLAR